MAQTRLRARMTAIHQMLTGFSFGDAISNHAQGIRSALRDWGYQSDVFSVYIDKRLRTEARRHVELAKPRGHDCGLIFHHSIGSPATELVLSYHARRMLIYHNITPAEFYEPYDPQKAALLREGREELRRLSGRFNILVGDSAYNAAELEEYGLGSARVLPILVRFGDLDEPPCPRMLASLHGPERKVLFVGRIAPNKKQDDVITAFAHYQRIQPQSRLFLVGDFRPEERYYHAVQQRIRDTSARGVVVTGQVTQAELNALYQQADLFLSMSEHEGFGVPLVEAMYFDVPVLAYRATAVPETMGGAGVLFTQKRYPEVAEMMDLLIEDQAVRERVLAGQRRRLQAFLPVAVLPRLRELIEEFERL